MNITPQEKEIIENINKVIDYALGEEDYIKRFDYIPQNVHVRLYDPYISIFEGPNVKGSIYFTVYSKKINEITTYGNFRLKSSITYSKNNYYSTQNTYKKQILLSVSEGPWVPVSRLVSAGMEYNKNIYRYKIIISGNEDKIRYNVIEKIKNELVNEIQKVKLEKKKIYTKNQSRKRKLKLEKEAKELGISIEELKEKNKKHKAEIKRKKDTLANIETTKRLLKVAPKITELQNKIETFLSVAKNTPGNLKIIDPDRKLKKINEAILTIERWSGN